MSLPLLLYYWEEFAGKNFISSSYVHYSNILVTNYLPQATMSVSELKSPICTRLERSSREILRCFSLSNINNLIINQATNRQFIFLAIITALETEPKYYLLSLLAKFSP